MSPGRCLCFALLMLTIVATACAPASETLGKPKATPSGPAFLNGAGATFPFPIYSKWFDAYAKLTGVRINYQSIGSGGGIKQIIARTVDFGASDAPMADEQLAQAPGALLHVPMVLGAVAVVYNLPALPSGLKLTPEAVAGIFLGQITRWNDPEIASANPEAVLPDLLIPVVHRSDGSGTTNIFTDYLSTVSPTWKDKVGQGTAVRWPVGIGGKGNEGVAGQVKQTPGSIGYMELAYAEQNKISVASIRNQAGEFITPSVDSTTAAAAGAQIPEDLRFSIVNAAGRRSYPISGATWILAYREQADQFKGQALADFLLWALNDGQGMARDLIYAPLPAELAAMGQSKVKSITYQGQPLVKSP